tara:strand:- start:93 stop:479 length:387 start_codon:yes stop_codon:yes gene_type:complete
MKEKDKRPVYLNILAINLPIIGITSILHRISGFTVFIIFLLYVFMLDRSLSSEEDFLILVNDFQNIFFFKISVSLISLGLLFHSLIGVKKLILDFFGIGEKLKTGSIISWLSIGIFIIFSFFIFSFIF